MCIAGVRRRLSGQSQSTSSQATEIKDLAYLRILRASTSHRSRVQLCMPSDALCSKRGSGLPIVWRHSDVAATQQNPTAICESVKNIIGYSVIDRLMCARIIASECQSTESNGTFLAKWHTIQPSTERARATLSRCLFIYLVFAIVIVTKKVVTLILDTTIVHHVCATVDFSSQIPSECV